MPETRRLILRQWRDSDLPEFVALNADAQVMEYFPNPLTEQDTLGFAGQCRQLIEERDWGFWATEIKSTAEFIGMVGLNVLPFAVAGDKPNEQRIEVGWRLSKRYWGQGYAPEAANAALEYAFQTLRASSVCAITPVANQRSRRVMEKLHMSDTHKNFQHPRIPPDNALAEHVLYEISKVEYLKSRDWLS